MRCRNCGTEFEGNFCPECGTRASRDIPSPPPVGNRQGLESHPQGTGGDSQTGAEANRPRTVRCRVCGTRFEGIFCPECGTRAAEDSYSDTPVRRREEAWNYTDPSAAGQRFESADSQQSYAYQQTASVPPQYSQGGKKKGKKAGNKTPKKKPIFLRWWFILLVILAVFFVYVYQQSEGENQAGKKTAVLDWSAMELGNRIPEPPADDAEVIENSDEALRIFYNSGMEDKEYNDYLDACMEKGFTGDPQKSSVTYKAYDADGYCLDMSHTGNTLTIAVFAPMEMQTITWPAGAAGSQLPVPESTTGKFSYERDTSFFVYVGDTDKEAYEKYVSACSERGFNVDYSREENAYDADNAAGWHVSIRFEGNSIMSIEIKAPKDYVESTAEADLEEDTKAAVPETLKEERETEAETETETETDTEAETEAQPVSEGNKEAGGVPIQVKPSTEDAKEEVLDENGLRPDFKAAMDSYEKFMGEYVSFVENYDENSTDLSIIGEYAEFMKKYVDFADSFEEWESEDLNSEELKYYIDVQARVTEKLAGIATDKGK